MTDNSPSHLIVLKPNGQRGCRDCDYVTPYRKWNNMKKDVARHWNSTHLDERKESTEDSPALRLRDAAENVIIAYGMGWNLEGVVLRLQEALKDYPDV